MSSKCLSVRNIFTTFDTLLIKLAECDISSRDFSVSRLFSFLWEYQYRSQKQSLSIGLKNIWSRKNVSVSVSKIFGLKKSLVSVTKRFGLEKSLSICLENFGLEKQSRYRSRKYLVSKKVSVSVSKIFGLEKKSRYRSRKFWSQKSLSIGLKNFVLKKSSSYADVIFQRDRSNTFNDFVS